MGLFGSLTNLAVNVVTTPVAVAADVVTLGGTLTGRKKTYTAETVEDAVENIGDVFDDIFG